MVGKFKRHPIGNFFIMKGLQVRLIKKIVFSAIISTVVGLSTLILIYYLKFDNTAFYPVSFDSAASIGERENILAIILPSVILSAFINILIAIAIGLYASRKYAVPIFKLEKWADLLKEGHISAKLFFREKEEMKELSSKCNSLGDYLKDKFQAIQNSTEVLLKEESLKENPNLKEIAQILDSLSLVDDHIEVDTSVFHADDITSAGKISIE